MLLETLKKLLEWYESLKEVTINEIIEFHAKFEKYIHFKMEMAELVELLHLKNV